MAGQCIFCKIVEDRSMAPQWLAESDRALAFLDIHPIRVGHTLVIPKAHSIELFDVAPEDWVAVGELTTRVARLLREALGTRGENLFAASGPGSEQSVFHLHVHIIPRTTGDDLRWNDWWATKVFTPPQSDLVALAKRIRG
ncbi:MAG: HIT domain-containing protein [Thermoplasmata archaeon]|nr:HIT domain-containing protein [Thermoplasmata archaeon]